MSCEFCNNFDFTSVAVKENNIHTAGGSSRFTDDHYRSRPEYKLFNYCPICGANLCYYVEADPPKETDTTAVVVAVDCNGRRIPFAIEDDDCTMSEEEYYAISNLKADYGVNWLLAKDAYTYAKRHNGDYKMMGAYCKAKVCTVKLDEPLDKRVKRFMEDM